VFPLPNRTESESKNFLIAYVEINSVLILHAMLDLFAVGRENRSMRRTQRRNSVFKSSFGFLATVLIGVAGTLSSSGAVVFSENFDTYSNGPLTNQGSWLATANVAGPIQVSSGRAQLATSGQDAYAAFSAPLANADGTSLFYGLTVYILSAQVTGDYFFHLSNPAGTTSLFYDRLFARSSGGGFQFGFVDTSGTGSTITWGSAVLSLTTDYRVVVAQNFVAGAFNDTLSLYVNPTDTLVEGNNTAYLTHTWTATTSAETATYAAANLRQGTAANAPGVLVDDILISKTFSEVSAVPEPSAALLLVAGGAWAIWLRRRR
jgi:hypothetical protein